MLPHNATYTQTPSQHRPNTSDWLDRLVSSHREVTRTEEGPCNLPTANNGCDPEDKGQRTPAARAEQFQVHLEQIEE